MDIEDLGVLGDWYEDQGENGELVRNLLYILNCGSVHIIHYNYLVFNYGNGIRFGYAKGHGRGLGYVYLGDMASGDGIGGYSGGGPGYWHGDGSVGMT